MEKSEAFSEKHQLLFPMAGEFNAEIKFFSEDEKVRSVLSGKMSNKMILGGRFLEQDFNGEIINDQSFNGRGFFGYNEDAKIWQSCWIDTASTQMQIESGRYQPQTIEWVMSGQIKLADGKQIEKIDRIRIHSNNQHSLVMSFKDENKKETRMMEIKYSRVGS